MLFNATDILDQNWERKYMLKCNLYLLKFKTYLIEM